MRIHFFPTGMNMRRYLYLGILLPSLGLIACSSIYSQNMFQGKDLLAQEEYGQARSDFLKAYEARKDPDALVFAATTSYKLNDLPTAEQYITDAEKSMKATSVYYLRMLGYKALVLLRQRKDREGLKALRTYLDTYRNLYPLLTINKTETMMKQEKINMTLLEELLDEQITVYEDEVTEYLETGNGFLDRGVHTD